MFPDLPAHLQTLNTVVSPPSGVMNPAYEDAVWDFLHTDELFGNFGVQPSDDKFLQGLEQPQKQEKVEEWEKQGNHETGSQAPADLKSFIAQFGHETPGFALPLPLPYNAAASSSNTQTPVPGGANASDIMPFNSASWDESPSEDGQISGSKNLKQVGAGVTEIEEDKRRRNTEASARFRAKKKEREQALDKRAKVLEAQVSQLIADKASLESENRLLKAIVLGAGAGGQSQDGLHAAIAAVVGGKRKRE